MVPQDFLIKRHKECVTRMFKSTLRLVEDMKADHDYHLRKIKDNIPSEYHPILDAADHFDAVKLAWIRKKVLDLGNETLREFESELENFTVSFIFK